MRHYARGKLSAIFCISWLIKTGQPIASEIDNLICSIELKDLREMLQWGVPVVVTTSGEQKAEIAQTDPARDTRSIYERFPRKKRSV